MDPHTVLEAIERHRENDACGRGACEHWGSAVSVSRVRIPGAGHPELDLAVKWCRWRGLRGALSDGMFGSRAERARRGGHRVAATGVSTPRPLAVAERRRFGLPVESFLVTPFLAGSVPLPAILPELAAAPRRRRALATALGELVGDLHASGVHHADLKHSNLLVGPDGRVDLVDLDSLVPTRRLIWRRRVRALGQLEAYSVVLYPWLPRTDRARFLQAYLARNPDVHAQRSRLVADVRRWVISCLDDWSRRGRTALIIQAHTPAETRP